MKRKLAVLTCLSFIAGLAGCSKEEIVTINQEGANIFPASTIEEDGSIITMGDVMPFYDNGVMNIYHLKNISSSNSLFYHPIARISTTDYIHYKDEGVALDYVMDVNSHDAALGTGSFIKDEEGVYHAFYTGHNSELEYVEVIRHATSRDGQKTWQKEEEFVIKGANKNDFRDPYVYHDSDGKYYMLITTTNEANAGTDKSPSVIRRYRADSLNAKCNEWEDVGDFFTNDIGNFNMECPSYVEWNGYYYLAFSEQGENRVTHYRYKTSKDGNWIRPALDAIDDAGFYAGRLEKAGDKLFAFAWCARLTGGNSGSFDWAGNLVTHQMKQNTETGELYATMPDTYETYFSHDIGSKNAKGESVNEFTFSGSKFEATAMQELSSNVTRMNFKVTPKALDNELGITFGIKGDYNNRLGGSVISFDFANNKIVCYNSVSNILRYGNPLAKIKYDFEVNKEYNVDLVVDGEVCSVYVNDEVAVSARFIDMIGNNFGFYSNKANGKISGVKIYE